ncbi:MAG: aminoacyltransferase [Candidatus Ancillula sp.]|jgi:lipid II:glycine glycyltransferase (peptidoglycan interpeptide bridge formation enzyme)|nr:aminoacyltransferase [Candidatus Ancillula sp.]
MQFKELTDEEFDKFAKNYDQANFNQCSEMGNIRKQSNSEVFYLGILKNEKIIAACLLEIPQSKIKHGVISFGPLLDYDNLNLLSFWTKEIKLWGSQYNLLYITIRPYLPYQLHESDGKIIQNTQNDTMLSNLKSLQYNHFGWTITGDDAVNRWHYCKNISSFNSYDELFSSLDSETRRRIRYAKKHGVTVRELTLDEIDIFINTFEDTAKRLNFKTRDENYYYQLKKQFGDKCILLVAEVDINGEKKIASSGLFIKSNTEFIHYLGGNRREFMKYKSSYAIEDWGLKYTFENKLQIYNMLGINGNFDKTNGLWDFKSRFNGFIRELPGLFTLPIKQPQYLLFNIADKILTRIRKICSK